MILPSLPLWVIAPTRTVLHDRVEEYVQLYVLAQEVLPIQIPGTDGMP